MLVFWIILKQQISPFCFEMKKKAESEKENNLYKTGVKVKTRLLGLEILLQNIVTLAKFTLSCKKAFSDLIKD